MTSRERVLAAIQHKEADRVAIHDSPWATTEARWHREGLPQGQSSAEYFGFEFRTPWVNNSLMLETSVIEETDEYTIATTQDGATFRNWKGKTSTPELIDFSITTREKWEEVKPRMVMRDDRVDWENGLKANREQRERGLFVACSFGPGFTKVCNMVGPERLMMTMIDDPEWVKDMFMTDAQLCVDVAEEMMGRGFEFDAGWVFDDLGFRDRPFFSPQMYRELLMPAHRLICDCFKARGLPMLLHSCGNNMQLAPLLIECGFDVLQPLEVKAGNDMLLLKQRFGDRLALMGGIDVRAMASDDPTWIEREISTKIPAAMAGGGYIYHSDHSVPDNVSFQQYERVIDLVRHYGTY
ncbi:MAG: uroporphyrinogen decarboxylase family protein [Armatimonadota bacterium]